ncbi:MAG: prepilin-type N-terminal cleavage/methylation domain-containing protein [Burkholderiaceae bacterium]|nr:prepilin-type N-terminal cleavage/methylation domain-containing protein [Burkholderiaceae bacterium]
MPASSPTCFALTVMRPQSSSKSSAQRGLSIVEMMVGLTIGLIVVAAASQVVVTQLNENRKLLVEMQLQQDLRAAADIITRELRRAGAWSTAENGIWFSSSNPGQQNPLREVTVPATGLQVDYWYRRDPDVEPIPLGFRLSQQRVETLLGAGWQELTDGRSIRVTSFSITPLSDPAVPLPCPKFCPDAPNSTACWPTVQTRLYEVHIAAQAIRDSSVQRSIRTTVQLRNDLVGNNSLAAPVRACPL